MVRRGTGKQEGRASLTESTAMAEAPQKGRGGTEPGGCPGRRESNHGPVHPRCMPSSTGSLWHPRSTRPGQSPQPSPQTLPRGQTPCLSTVATPWTSRGVGHCSAPWRLKSRRRCSRQMWGEYSPASLVIRDVQVLRAQFQLLIQLPKVEGTAGEEGVKTQWS